MKKLGLCLMTVLLLLAFVPMKLNAEPESVESPKVPTEVVISDEAKVLLNRLEEIKAMDMSELTAPERKELRKEVRTIKQELKELGTGVYISVGAIIIIILLLILLL